MPRVELLTQTSLQSAIRSLPGLARGGVTVRGLNDISPGIGPSRVFRVFLAYPAGDGLPRTVILKIPDWEAETLLDPRDPWLSRRERAFFEVGLAARLPSGVRTPAVLAIQEREGRTWVWMEDLAASLRRVWHPDDAIEAARRSALLHDLYRQQGPALAGAGWLERHGYAAYAHQIPSAHRNLDRISSHPEWSSLLSAGEIDRLHRCLNASRTAVSELAVLPVSLIHGDFHIRNLGFDEERALVCIDWAHVGLAPLGSDIAVLVSLYRAFGGRGQAAGIAFDREVVAAYSGEVERLLEKRDRSSAIGRTFALWHLTWGLHLRLGPGLTYLLGTKRSQDAEAAHSAEDIREGCERALLYVTTLAD